MTPKKNKAPAKVKPVRAWALTTLRGRVIFVSLYREVLEEKLWLRGIGHRIERVLITPTK